ncbi:MAG TPA: hypothetical protein VFN19_09780, partial [Candidatus Nanopelagicales bacterium]|nr:hypothetical protein [Candidatus Nanopelagicales bacterium]
MVGVVVVAVVLLAAVGFGLWRRRNDGRLHRQEAPGVVAAGERVSADDLASPLGERATLVQFSTAF